MWGARYLESILMLAEIYIEAVLVDEDLADEVWEAWNADEIDDLTACITWLLVATNSSNWSKIT